MTVVPLTGGGPVMWTADRRLCLTEDGRLVAEDNPAARWLWCTPGMQVPLVDARRLGAVADEAPGPEQAAEPKAKADPAPAEDAESEDKPKPAAKRTATKADAP